jgi:D-citramalate synthase
LSHNELIRNKKRRLLRKIYIISDVLDSQSYQERIVVESYILSHARTASINYFVFKIDGEIIEEHAQGDGQFDAFMNALAKNIRVKFRTTKAD